MQITIKITNTILIILGIAFLILVGIGYTKATESEGVYHNTEDIISSYGGEIVTYPTEVKMTTEEHNGSFGGYDGITQFIYDNGCPESEGWHVCQGWELVHFFSIHGYHYPDFPIEMCGGDGCMGWFSTGTGTHLSPSNVGDCDGWVTSYSDRQGHWWGSTKPFIVTCDKKRNVLCCR